MAVRSRPMPKAQPDHSSGLMPAISSTRGWIIPAPSSSIQPSPLQVEQPAPPHLWHCTSISQDGSVKGKWWGRNRVAVPGPNSCSASRFRVPFRSAMVTFLSMTIPST